MEYLETNYSADLFYINKERNVDRWGFFTSAYPKTQWNGDKRKLENISW